MNNPFMFACGVPRSGTTLLQRMLNHHPELAVVNDSHFIPRALELTDKALIDSATRGESIPLTPGLITNVRNYHRFWRLELSSVEFESILSRSNTYQQLVSGVYCEFATKANKRFAGEKTPDYVRRLSLLHGMFPDAKFLHLVRDGRNVALSLMDWATPTKGPGRIEKWEQQPVAVCAMWWRWLVLASREQQLRIAADRYLEITYEKLVIGPRAQMQRACGFLDLEYSDSMLEYHRGKTRKSKTLSAKSAWLAPQAGLRDWKTDLTSSDTCLFEALAGDALLEFGYELSGETPTDEVCEIAQQCREWWDANFLARHRPEPALTNPPDSNRDAKQSSNEGVAPGTRLESST